MVVQCCVCGRIRKGAHWVRAEHREDPEARVSHGYCPTCAAKAFEDIQNYRKHIAPSSERALSA